MHGASPLAAWVVSLVQKSLNGAVWNSIVMFGYFAVTISPTSSHAFFSTSEPDHMNQEGHRFIAAGIGALRGPRCAAARREHQGGCSYCQNLGETGKSHGTPSA